MSVRVALTNLPIRPMNEELGTLVLGNGASRVNRFLLSGIHAADSIRVALANGPSVVMRHYVVRRFVTHLKLLKNTRNNGAGGDPPTTRYVGYLPGTKKHQVS